MEARDQAVFQFALPHGAADSEELEVVGTLEHFFGLLGEVLGKGESEVVGFFIGDCAFVGSGLDLVEQNISSPSEAGCGLQIPKARYGCGYLVDDKQILTPRNFCDKSSQKWNNCFGGWYLKEWLSDFCDKLLQIWIFDNLGKFACGFIQKMCVGVEKKESPHVPDIPCREAGGLREFPAKVG